MLLLCFNVTCFHVTYLNDIYAAEMSHSQRLAPPPPPPPSWLRSLRMCDVSCHYFPKRIAGTIFKLCVTCMCLRASRASCCLWTRPRVAFVQRALPSHGRLVFFQLGGTRFRWSKERDLRKGGERDLRKCRFFGIQIDLYNIINIIIILFKYY